MTRSVDKLLRKFRHPKLNRAFILGCTSPFLNINAQQQRAFNLAYVLLEKPLLVAGMDVAIVGGGIAGLSAATALLANGIRVTIYERMHEVLSLQRGNLTRYVHPQIARWPDKASGYPLTDFPYMNWQGGTVGRVILELNEQWREIRNIFGPPHLTVNIDCKVRELSITAGGAKVRVHTKLGFSGNFDYAIVAAGYGLEDDLGSTPSYWHNDDFSQPVLDPRVNQRKYFVSGVGDGGLTEVLRLKLSDFQHQEFLESVIFQQNFLTAGRLAKENNWEAAWNETDQVAVRANFANFFSNHRERKDTKVVLSGRARKVWYTSQKAQVLHRVCVKLLQDAQLISYAQSTAKTILLKRLCGYKFITRHGTISPLLRIRPELSETELKEAKDSTATSDEQIPKPYRRTYSISWLSDELMRAHYEAEYEVCFAPMTGRPDEFQDKARVILSYLSSVATNQELDSMAQTPIVRQWRTRDFSLRTSGVRIITHRGFTPPENNVTLPTRTFEPTNYQALILRTQSKALLDFLLDRNALPYHLYRIYLADNFPLQAQNKIDRLVITNAFVFLVDLWQDQNCIEVHCARAPGMHQAHRLLRVPTLIRIMQNRWTLNAVGGIGWAVQNRAKVNREHQRGNELLNRPFP